MNGLCLDIIEEGLFLSKHFNTTVLKLTVTGGAVGVHHSF